MTDKKCDKCKKGKYMETSLYDDINGVLHCKNCDDKINRWEKEEEDGDSYCTASYTDDNGSCQQHFGSKEELIDWLMNDEDNGRLKRKFLTECKDLEYSWEEDEVFIEKCEVIIPKITEVATKVEI